MGYKVQDSLAMPVHECEGQESSSNNFLPYFPRHSTMNLQLTVVWIGGAVKLSAPPAPPPQHCGSREAHLFSFLHGTGDKSRVFRLTMQALYMKPAGSSLKK